MKKLILLSLLLTMSLCSLLHAGNTSQSVLYSDSFLMRAQGAEALYWNPAALTSDYRDMLIPILNTSMYVTNNSFDLETYDLINGHYLDNADKDEVMRQIRDKLAISGESHTTIFGIAFSNMAFASSVHVFGQARMSEQYIKLLLYGNEQSDYAFDKKYNQASALAYQDFTLGVGNIRVNDFIKYENLPELYFGASGSILAGYGVVDTKKYSGSFHTGLDGFSLHQNVKLGTGTGGIGFKSMLGLISQPYPNLSVGLSLDNLLGNIQWFAKTEDRIFNVDADSIYAADLSEDLINQEDSTITTSAFSTTLPPELRLGGVYYYGPASVSLDWVQGFSNSHVTSSIGRVSIGGEFCPMPSLPLSMGVTFGNGDYPWRMSYGIGVRAKRLTAGIGIQAIKTWDLLGTTSKGVSFSTYLTVPY